MRSSDMTMDAVHRQYETFMTHARQKKKKLALGALGAPAASSGASGFDEARLEIRFELHKK